MMRNNSKQALLAVALLLLPAAAKAQVSQWLQADSVASGHVTTAAYMVGVGPTRLQDTYLSTAHFKGTGVSFLASRERCKPAARWSTLMEHQAHLSLSRDRADKAKALEGAYDFYMGRLRAWLLMGGRLRLQAGVMGDVGVGFVYNTVNGNNPAQARLHLQVMPSATATYRFSLWGRAMAARYEVQVPLVGLMFSPNYGQSYYELFSRGDYDHNVVPTTLASTPSLRHLLTLDVALGRSATLRVGYLGDYQQAHVNGIKSHTYSHRLMIGLVKRFQLINYRP